MNTQSTRYIGRLGLVVGLLCCFALTWMAAGPVMSGILFFLAVAGYVLYVAYA